MNIQRIEIYSCGPITKFEEDIYPLTVIYAKNEKGKTTIVENIIASLFKNQKDKMFPTLRGDNFIGPCKIVVSGISDRPTEFSPHGRKKIDDFLVEDGSIFPKSVYNLLYIKGAETEIVKDSGGIDKTTLKRLISKQNILQKIEDEIPPEVSYTSFDGKSIIEGHKKGLYKKYIENQEKLINIREITENFYRKISQTEIVKLNKEQKALLEQKEKMRKAKGYYAFELSEKIKQIKYKLSLMTDSELKIFESDIHDYVIESNNLPEKEIEFSTLEGVEDDIEWITKAEKDYTQITSISHRKTSLFITIAALILIIISIILYFYNSSFFLIFLGISLLFLLFTIFFSLIKEKEDNKVVSRTILDEIKQQFEIRYDQELKSLADFGPLRKKFEKKAWKKSELESEIRVNRENMKNLKTRIEIFLEKMKIQADPEEWTEQAVKLNREREKMKSDLATYETMLDGLDVDESDFEEVPQTIKYSRSAENNIDERIASIDQRKKEQVEEFNVIRSKLSNHIGEKAFLDSFEEISDELCRKEDEYRREVMVCLSKIIAGHIVKEIIDEYIKEEDKQIEDYLNDDEITEFLHKFTRTYDKIAILNDDILVEHDEESYNIKNLGTGAQQQVLLALRIGITRMLTKKENLFLILDDAFQYSDWERRQYLVENMVDLVEEGWQVVYFTMDDDINQRFSQEGKRLKEGLFKMITL
jgi:hypothetical protein